MAYHSLSVGDIMMLSQQSWKVGNAFAAGRSGAPPEFQEVEDELRSLTGVITNLAETIDNDRGTLARSDQRTRESLDKILICSRQTLENLESFVNQYQEIQRPGSNTGTTLQRSWRSILVRNWKKIIWTAEGGGINSLKKLLAMHIQSITLAYQALQSQSLSRLEQMVEPVADQIDSLGHTHSGDYDAKIDEILISMLSLTAMLDSSPIINSARRDWGSTPSSARESRASNYLTPRLHARGSPSNHSQERDRFSYDPPSPAASSVYLHNSDLPELGDTQSLAQSLYADRRVIPVSSRERQNSAQAPEVYVPPMSRYSPASTSASQFSGFRNSNQRFSDPFLTSSSMLPPPAMNDMQPDLRSLYAIEQEDPIALEILETIDAMTLKGDKDMIASAGSHPLDAQEGFKRNLFKDAAILCEVRGKCVEYTQPDEEKLGEWKMVNASDECDVYLVTKKKKLSSGAMRYSTSIWTLSDDRSVRVEQHLEDGEEIIPYTVWGNDAKVVLRVATDLKFRDTSEDSNPVKIARTHWVNYIFEHERAATNFQNALIGRTLILSVKTRRTMRIHDGITGAFTYAEQLCGLENLRIFQDPDTGGVLALIHYSPHFRDGYMAFYLNSARDRITIKDDGENTIKIKGLKIPIDRKRSIMRRDSIDHDHSPKIKSEKCISGAKIEFYTREDKMLFQDKIREIQGTFFPGER